MALNAVTSALSDSIDYIIPRRQREFDYLKRVFASKAHWLNVIKISQEDFDRVDSSGDVFSRRGYKWLTLGYSMGLVLDGGVAAVMTRATIQLMLEFEHFLDHQTKESVSLPSAGDSQISDPSSSLNLIHHYKRPLNVTQVFLTQTYTTEPIEAIKPVYAKLAFKYNEYQLLLPPLTPRPFSFNYVQVVISLIDILSLLYTKLSQSNSNLDPQQLKLLTNYVVRMDKLIRTNIVLPLCNELEQIASSSIRNEWRSCLNSLILQANSTQISAKLRYHVLDVELDEGRSDND